MKKTNDLNSCIKTPSYAPGSTVGPNEFDHALECDSCWKALVRWMDAEVVSLPESARIRERASRLAGAGEVIAAMVSDEAAAASSRRRRSCRAQEKKTTLTDLLEGEKEPTLIQGPWKNPTVKRTRNAKGRNVCVNATTPLRESSSAPAGECSAAASGAPCGPDVPTSPQPRRWLSAAEANRNDAAVALGPATVAPECFAIDAGIAALHLAKSLGVTPDVSASRGAIYVCIGGLGDRASADNLCANCRSKGFCQLALELEKSDGGEFRFTVRLPPADFAGPVH
jgi:hypothetical protein